MPLLPSVVLAVAISLFSLPAVIFAGERPLPFCGFSESLEGETILCSRKKHGERQLPDSTADPLSRLSWNRQVPEGAAPDGPEGIRPVPFLSRPLFTIHSVLLI